MTVLCTPPINVIILDLGLRVRISVVQCACVFVAWGGRGVVALVASSLLGVCSIEGVNKDARRV